MQRRFRWGFGVLVAGALLVSSAVPAWAQGTAGITGRVEDDTEGVLPGVNVRLECACLAVAREAFTGGVGRYNITTLPIGTYTVTFTLAGFSTYVVEEVDLAPDFTATVNAVMPVGALEETVTVTGESPTVDIVNVQTQQRQDMDTLEALPSGARGISSLAGLTLAATNTTSGRNDVGGALEDLNTGLSIHGSEGDQGRVNYSGMNMNVQYGDGGGQMRIWKFNTIMVQETTINAGGAGADTESGGAHINMIPREGSNQFTLNSYLTDVNGDFSSGAVPSDVLDRISDPVQRAQIERDGVNNVNRVFDYAVGAGGALVNDKVWYYAGGRKWGGEVFSVDNFYNVSPVWYRYEAGPNKSLTDNDIFDIGTRFTIQAAERHRIATSVDVQRGCNCDLALNITSLLAPEASTDFEYGIKTDPLVPGPSGRAGMYNWITEYTSPITNRLLIDAGINILRQHVNFHDRQRVPNAGYYPVIDLNDPVKNGLFLYGALGASGQGGSYYRPHGNDQAAQRASISYVTGSHNFKVGFNGMQGDYDVEGGVANMPLEFIMNGGSPLIITQHAVPRNTAVRVRRYGFFAQDQWTMDRLTLNLGVRYDYHHSFALPVTMEAGLPFQIAAGPGMPATTYAPFTTEATQYPGLDELPKYQDITPRFGVAYDLRGDGKTAIKASWGKYIFSLGGGSGRDRSPSFAIFGEVNRFWFDNAASLPFVGAGGGVLTGNEVAGDFIPQCDFSNSAANGECGPTQGVRVDQLRDRRSVDPWSANVGWGLRRYSNELSVGVQHELMRGVGLSISYHRNSWHNQQYDWNRALTAADFTRGTLSAPNDPVLGDGSGGTVQIWDINTDARGRADDVRTPWQDIPGSGNGPKEVFNGVDIGVNARFDNGALVAGGVTLGRRVNDSCWLNDLPQVDQGNTIVRGPGFCDATTALWDSAGSQMKVQFVYPLPYDFVLSGTAKTLPGPSYDADVLFSAAELTAALGRAPSGGASSRLNVLPTGTLVDDRLNQLDLRLTKNFSLGGAILNLSAELYNIFNSRAVQGTIEDYGPAFRFPEGLLGGRFFKYVVGVDF